jgi:hypothetical protein
MCLTTTEVSGERNIMKKLTQKIIEGLQEPTWKVDYKPSAQVNCSTQINPFSQAWWKIIEANRIEKAHNFGPNADVLSAISARAMVLDALKWFKLRA